MFFPPASRPIRVSSLSAFLDQLHLLAFLFGVARVAAWLLLVAVVFLPLELLTALHPRKFFCKSLAGDIGFYFISGLIPGLLLAPPMALVAMGAHVIVPYSLHAAVAAWPIWARALAALVVGESGFYWGHRWAHEIPLLWRFHAIHHSAEEIDWLVNTRAHPFDIVRAEARCAGETGLPAGHLNVINALEGLLPVRAGLLSIPFDARSSV